MAVVRASQAGTPYGQEKGEGQANLPSDALHHYPANQAVADELVGDIGAQALQGEQLYRSIAQGTRGKGSIAVAVPAADGQVHVPAAKPVGAHLIVTRAPYEDAKHQPIALEKVAPQDPEKDPTTKALGEWVTVQYSHVGRIEDEQREPDERELWFAKGLLVVVPDAYWPDKGEYKDCDIVMSHQDEKSRSSWTEGKQRYAADTVLDSAGVLSVGEVFAPGSTVAVPPATQKRMGGDFDGDPDLLLSGLPALHAHVLAHQQQQAEQADDAGRLQIKMEKKSHRSAFKEDGTYQHGRSAQIVAAKLPVLGKYTVLQRRLYAQPLDSRERIAQAMLWGPCEGLSPELVQAMQTVLDAEEPEAPANPAVKRVLDMLDQAHKAARSAQSKKLYAALHSEWQRIGSHNQPSRPSAEHDEVLRSLLPAADKNASLPDDPLDRLALWLEAAPWSQPRAARAGEGSV